jgi:hypothetical protein
VLRVAGVSWCPEGDLNPHRPFGPADFKSAASASFAIRALRAKVSIRGRDKSPSCQATLQETVPYWRANYALSSYTDSRGPRTARRVDDGLLLWCSGVRSVR